MSKVKIYTQDGCVHCKEVKHFFKEKNVEFEEIHASDGVEFLNSIKAEYLPITVVEDWVEGPDIESIKKRLNI